MTGFNSKAIQGAHGLEISWKTLKNAKNNSRYGKIMEFHFLSENHGKIMEFHYRSASMASNKCSEMVRMANVLHSGESFIRTGN